MSHRYFPHTPYLKDVQTVTDGHHMDKAPGVNVSIYVRLLDIGRNRRPDLMTLILCWSAFTACVLRLVLGRTVAILGSCILSSILLIHPQVCMQGIVCVCVCVCVCVWVCVGVWVLVSGEPLGERQGSHCP